MLLGRTLTDVPETGVTSSHLSLPASIVGVWGRRVVEPNGGEKDVESSE